MRLLNLNYLSNCKFKSTFLKSCRNLYYVDSSAAKIDVNKSLEGDPSYIEISSSWKPDEEAELRQDVLRHMRVLPDFVSEAEEAALVAEVEPRLKRMRYEFDHWDNAIEGYRETERSEWSAGSAGVLARVRAAAFAPEAQLLPHVHVLDLAAAGYIRPHVDAVRFCGDTIAGLSLLSSAVMRLTLERCPALALDALLPRRSLYIMSGSARYEFSHAVLGGEHSLWRGSALPRRRRLALICRERPAAQ